ncbi:signal transducer and activator of transcription 5A-like isoform X2 [Sycon ciliatum]|uniref:signal transducer and activator of transcription 5A-like isoform X2 n=1 Tax=Sycon ciliatum TaxID=27933 RepID=UPI0031F70EB0
MAFKGQWAKVQGSDISRQLAEVYGDFFPLEARHYFCDWLEDQTWDRVNLEEDIPQAQILFSAFLDLITVRVSQCNENNEFVMRLQFEKLHSQLMMRYGERPLEFVRTVHHCLNREQAMLSAHENCIPPAAMNGRHSIIQQTLTQGHSLVEQLTCDVRTLQAKQEAIITLGQELARIRESMQNMTQALGTGCQTVPAQAELTAVRQLETSTSAELHNAATLQLTSRSMVYQKTNDLLHACAATLGSIVEELSDWRYLQYKARGGGPPPGPLDMIQKWCEALADILWTCRRQVQQLQHQKSQLQINKEPDPELPDLDLLCRRLLYQLMTKSFIVERQPQQVIKTNTRFGASVRMLAGSKLSLHLINMEVEAHIIPTQLARTIIAEPNYVQLPSNRSDLKNTTKVMEYDRSTEVFGADFTNMILPRRPPVRRSGGHADLSVAEEKFCLVFIAKCVLGNGDIEIPLMAISCPLVVIVHATQSVAAEATMFWDSAFSDPATFAHREVVEWQEMEKAVNLYFAKNCERGVDSGQLRCLYSKAFPSQEYNELTNFHINKFHREQMEARRFTFWSWIYSAADIIKKHALSMWSKGLIEGFLSREQAEEKLRTQQGQDTFLIRFSESTEGGLTVAFSEFDSAKGGRGLDHLQPWTAHDLNTLQLANRIRDFAFLNVLYPNTPKDSAFSQFYTLSTGSGEEGQYVPTFLEVKRKTKNSTNGTGGTLESNPSTPSSGENVQSPSTVSIQASSPMTAHAPSVHGNGTTQMPMPVSSLFEDHRGLGMLQQFPDVSMAGMHQADQLTMSMQFGGQFGSSHVADLVDRWTPAAHITPT